MFEEALKKRLECIDSNSVDISNERIQLEEKQASGVAQVQLHLIHPCIAFKKLEDKKLQYFNINNCADYVIFENVEKDKWVLHIIEFKRTVKPKEWNEKIKKQFAGAYLNALALGGYLGIKISKVICYTGLRHDKVMSKREASPIELRAEVKRLTQNTDWESGEIILDVFETIPCTHKKIQLDENTGEAAYKLCL